jgi:hypothetical protein
VTTPPLAVPILKRGRHYPLPPQDLSHLPRNRWGSISPEDLPTDVTFLPSVTNVLNVCDKPALKGWAAERALIELYESDAIPTDVSVAIERHKYAFQRYSKERADAGTRAHTIAQALTEDLPLPSSLSEEDEAFADAYMAFWVDHDPQPLEVEVTVYGEGYAGTADLIAEVGGVATVIDYKSRLSRDDKKIKRYGLLYDETKLQLAALSMAKGVAVVTADEKWEIVAPPPVKQAMGVVLFADGTYLAETLDEADLAHWYQGFLGAVGLWNAKAVAA